MRQYWNRTKVVCTIGPACSAKAMMERMVLSGMDIARFNFSHGEPSAHSILIRTLKKISLKHHAPVAVLQDLPGPKIRIGLLRSDFIELKKGQRFYLTSRKIVGDSSAVSVNHAQFVRQLEKKDIVYLNDGLVKLMVLSRASDGVACEVLTGGMIYPRKGVSCPAKVLKTDAVTAYDLVCLKEGIRAGIDYVAVSFVQRARDIEKVKRFIKRQGKDIFVVAKIERKVAFQEIDQIIKASDAVMVARGDLGIEADLAEVPFLQKEIIKKCNQQGRPVITATQMLESMVSSPQPTRAEVTDVANAIIDGTDALMLSEETAVGKYPLEALRMMVNIASKTEVKLNSFCLSSVQDDSAGSGIIDSFSQAAVNAAAAVGAKVIIVPTRNADSIARLSRLRPECAIAGITSDESVYRKFIMFWGVYPIKTGGLSNLAGTLDHCERLVKVHRLAGKNDRAVIMLTEDNGLFKTNIMEVRTIK